MIEDKGKDYIVLNEPIYLKDIDKYLDKFELNKINESNKMTINTCDYIPFVKNDSLEDEFNLIYVNKNSSYDKLHLKAELEYKNKKLLINFYKDIEKKNEDNLKQIISELIKTEEIDINTYFESLILSIRNNKNNITTIFDAENIKTIIDDFTQQIFLDFITNKDLYTTLNTEVHTNVEIYYYIEDKISYLGKSNRIILNLEKQEIMLCESILDNKLLKLLKEKSFSSNQEYNIALKIDLKNGKILTINIPNRLLIKNNDSIVKYLMIYGFNKYYVGLDENKKEFEIINNKKPLKYLKYKESLSSDEINFDNLCSYFQENNTTKDIKEFFRINKKNNVSKIKINNYLLYEMEA